MDRYKKWCIQTIVLILTVLLLIGSINFIVDPYQQYSIKSVPREYLESRMLGIQRQLAPGLAKNMDYNTALAGSSMSEYFPTDYIDKVMKVKSVKLSMSAGTTYEIRNVLDTALKTGKVKNALICVDVYMYDRPVEYTSSNLPTYLYDENKINDIKYLLNKDVLIKDTIPLLRSKLRNGDVFEWSNLYDNSRKCTFSKEETLTHYVTPKVSVKSNKIFHASEIDTVLEKDSRIPQMKENFEKNTLNIIKEHPEVKFTLFFPPNSILYWDNATRKNEVRNQASFKKYIYETLRSYPNVELYDFQDVKEITYNLDNYKDRSHYNPEVCKYIVDSIANKRNKLDDNNYIDKIIHLVNEAESFDLSQLK